MVATTTARQENITIIGAVRLFQNLPTRPMWRRKRKIDRPRQKPRLDRRKRNSMGLTVKCRECKIQLPKDDAPCPACGSVKKRFIVDHRPKGRYGRRIRIDLPAHVETCQAARQLENPFSETSLSARSAVNTSICTRSPGLRVFLSRRNLENAGWGGFLVIEQSTRRPIIFPASSSGAVVKRVSISILSIMKNCDQSGPCRSFCLRRRLRRS